MARNNLRLDTQQQKDIYSRFRYLSDRYGPWQIWSDFITLFACSLSLTDREKRDAEQSTIAKRYQPEELKRFQKMAALTVSSLEENPKQDFLGDLFMRMDLGKAGHDPICEYILRTGHKWPCPPGKGCIVKTKGHSDSMRVRSWDEARAKRLYDEGKSDLDIADMVGASEGAIIAWRRRNRLHSNVNPRGSNNPKEESVVTDSVPVEPPVVDDATEQKPMTSKDDVLDHLLSGPVEISFSYSGCNVMLTAPDQLSATWAAAYLKDIVDSLAPE